MVLPIAKVLVIDDEPDLRRIARFSLQAVGKWKVTACAGGAEGVEAALRDRPDVILLDVSMPGLDGPATLAALHGQPGLRTVPVLFMTATASPEARARLVSLGARGVILKPFDPMGLPGQVIALLAGPGGP